MSGVRFYILAHSADVTPFQSVIVHSAKNTVNISYRKVHPRSETVTLPFTIDMILYARTHFLTDGSIKSFAISVALFLAFSCLMRVSKYLEVPSSSYYLLGSGTNFLVGNKYSQNIINSSQMQFYLFADVIGVTR